ncbi:preprotein translocase, SecG subunit [Thermodesulfobium narugense DSM 14796]|uniref:Protein-export membrane protein SecG n=1 Tax=Thermodesulfobium narugense DSM 14796 TaxID=747365 RepID=M1E4Y1_9BACT|nr:preprotein translocase subunit SecG [Thermodesulfobium narugense]AEE13831.1 preprotein translocase, SecG subunit [Thermodesulfobium narugense DSM 14796]
MIDFFKGAILLFEVGVAILLIALILLHGPKGEGLGSIGGEARLFTSPQGSTSGLTRLTAYVAGVFIVLALLMGIFW